MASCSDSSMSLLVIRLVAPSTGSSKPLEQQQVRELRQELLEVELVEVVGRELRVAVLHRFNARAVRLPRPSRRIREDALGTYRYLSFRVPSFEPEPRAEPRAAEPELSCSTSSCLPSRQLRSARAVHSARRGAAFGARPPGTALVGAADLLAARRALRARSRRPRRAARGASLPLRRSPARRSCSPCTSAVRVNSSSAGSVSSTCRLPPRSNHSVDLPQVGVGEVAVEDVGRRRCGSSRARRCRRPSARLRTRARTCR